MSKKSRLFFINFLVSISLLLVEKAHRHQLRWVHDPHQEMVPQSR